MLEKINNEIIYVKIKINKIKINNSENVKLTLLKIINNLCYSLNAVFDALITLSFIYIFIASFGMVSPPYLRSCSLVCGVGELTHSPSSRADHDRE